MGWSGYLPRHEGEIVRLDPKTLLIAKAGRTK